MRRRAAAGALVVAVAAWSAAAGAAEFRGVAQAAVLYDGPSKQARKLFAAPRGMPLEVISTLGQWVKVRDVSGDVVWIERTDLGERRSVVTTVLATVRREPQDGAAPVMQADRGVLLDVVDTPPAEATAGWIRVRHRDGGAGWVRTTEVWGV
ncbi:MAG: SH3 domain-containing protein [Burkholderiales bacterium]|jgi:SH3-like domain-containing protein